MPKNGPCKIIQTLLKANPDKPRPKRVSRKGAKTPSLLNKSLIVAFLCGLCGFA